MSATPNLSETVDPHLAVTPYQLFRGARVYWVHRPRGGYGYVVRIPATVAIPGRKRTTIDAELASGKTCRVSVSTVSLRWRRT